MSNKTEEIIDVAIVIPTMNRSHFVTRLLHYYSNCLINGSIYIADSSDDEFHIKEIKKSILDVSQKIKVVYGNYPNANIEEAKRLILEDQVIEKYAAYCGDDDFLIPSTLSNCAIFLDNNKDYSNCHGVGVCIATNNDVLYGDIKEASEYKLLGIESDDPHQRIYDYLSDYWPIWSVRRVDEFKKTLGLLRTIPVETFREITMGCVPIIHGKTKLLNELYVVRQIHKNRFQSPGLIQALMLESWYKSHKEMYRILSNEIETTASTSKSKLDNFLKQGVINYYTSNMRSALSVREDNNIRKIRAFIRIFFPYIAHLFNKYFAKGLPLSRLRNKKSIYYNEFNKIDKFLKNFTKE